MNVKGTINEKIPYELDTQLRERIIKFAKEHGYTISEFVEHKIKWSETHGGKCPCSPLKRLKCPCDLVYQDMNAYNGRCLCRLLWKPEVYSKWKEQKLKSKKVEKPVLKISEKQQKRLKRKIKSVWKGLL